MGADQAIDYAELSADELIRLSVPGRDLGLQCSRHPDKPFDQMRHVCGWCAQERANATEELARRVPTIISLAILVAIAAGFVLTALNVPR